MIHLPDDVMCIILDRLGRPNAWTVMQQVCRDFDRVVAQRVTWAPYLIPTLYWKYCTGCAIIVCTASDVLEVDSHEPQFHYRTFALTPTSIVSQPCFECVRRNQYVHIHETWVCASNCVHKD